MQKERLEWSGARCPIDPDNFWIDDSTGERVSAVTGERTPAPVYYDCGICGALHRADWRGDCREDSARFDATELDKRHGAGGWREIAMEDLPV